jgi:hypothetical protein
MRIHARLTPPGKIEMACGVRNAQNWNDIYGKLPRVLRIALESGVNCGRCRAAIRSEKRGRGKR